MTKKPKNQKTRATRNNGALAKRNNIDFQGFKSLENKVSDILKPILGKKKNDFLVLDAINRNWQKIIGEKCWKFCSPKQIKFEKNKKNDAVLTISASNSSIGFYLESNINQIIQNIAAVYGYKIVSAIRIIQEPRIVEEEKKKLVKETDPKVEKFIKESLAEIKDEELKLTLENLGKSIFNK